LTERVSGGILKVGNTFLLKKTNEKLIDQEERVGNPLLGGFLVENSTLTYIF